MQPYVQLIPTHPAHQLSQEFPLGFPVTQETVHYQNVDTGKCALSGTQPRQFEAFTLDVERLTTAQAIALSHLYRSQPRLVSTVGTDREILEQIRFLAKDVRRVTTQATNQLQK